jgi:hypothetical protein
MSQAPPPATTALILGLAIAASGLASAANAHGAVDCGVGYDRCIQYCDAAMWGGPPASKPLDRCNTYCAQGSNICAAHQIPRPGGYRGHPIARRK